MDLTVRLMDWWSMIDQPLHLKNKTFRKSFFGWLNSCNMQMRLNVCLLRLRCCFVMEESLAVHFIYDQPNCTQVKGCKGHWLVSRSIQRKGQKSGDIFFDWTMSDQDSQSWVVFWSLLDCKKPNVFQYNSGLKYGRALSHCRHQEMN